jgi:hypothetical protein
MFIHVRSTLRLITSLSSNNWGLDFLAIEKSDKHDYLPRIKFGDDLPFITV